MGRNAGFSAERDLGQANPVAPVTGDPSGAGSGLTESSQLELRYRRLLRVLPAGYRAAREQEMVDTFLSRECDADPENSDLTLRLGWPGVREASSVLALAVRVRWAGVDEPERARVRAGAVRIAVLAALTVLVVIAVNALQGRIWLAATDPQDNGGVFPELRSVDALWPTVQAWSFLMWIAALAAALSARPRLAQWGCAIPLITTVIGIVEIRWSVGDYSMSIGSWAVLIVELAVLVGLTGLVNHAPVPDRRGWILTACAGIATMSAVIALAWLSPGARYPLGLALMDEAGVWCAATVIAAVVLTVRKVRGSKVSTEALLGVAGLAAAALALRAAMLADLAQGLPSDYRYTTPILVAGTIQLVAAAVVLAVTGTLGVRRFRRLPPVRYDVWATPPTPC